MSASHPACRLDDQPAPPTHRAASARHVGGRPVGAAGATGEALKVP